MLKDNPLSILFISLLQALLPIAVYLILAGLSSILFQIIESLGWWEYFIANAIFVIAIGLHIAVSIIRPGKHKFLTWALSICIIFLIYIFFTFK